MDDATGNPEPRAIAQVRRALAAAGLAARIVQMPASTRTAEEAAAACRCDVAQIVKSLVFRGGASGEPLLLLVSGRNRVDTAKVAATIGEALTRPDAQFVRDVTGFAIGGIPPFGHATPLATWADEDLFQYETVWAAAGTPNAVFSVNPARLRDAVGAQVIAVK